MAEPPACKAEVVLALLGGGGLGGLGGFTGLVTPVGFADGSLCGFTAGSFTLSLALGTFLWSGGFNGADGGLCTV